MHSRSAHFSAISEEKLTRSEQESLTRDAYMGNIREKHSHTHTHVLLFIFISPALNRSIFFLQYTL